MTTHTHPATTQANGLRWCRYCHQWTVPGLLGVCPKPGCWKRDASDTATDERRYDE